MFGFLFALLNVVAGLVVGAVGLVRLAYYTVMTLDGATPFLHSLGGIALSLCLLMGAEGLFMPYRAISRPTSTLWLVLAGLLVVSLQLIVKCVSATDSTAIMIGSMLGLCVVLSSLRISTLLRQKLYRNPRWRREI